MDPRRLLPTLAALAGLCVLLTLLVGPGRALLGGEGGGGRADAAPAPAAPAPPRSLLAQWDDRRAAAWSQGDPQALRGLYVAGSRSGEADVALLQDYVDRGLTVAGLRTQVLSLDVRHHDEDSLRLVVTDRVVGASAVGKAGPVPLPRDRPSTRRITMRRVQGEWLVAEVRDQASAAASTSETSSSSKS